MSPFVHVHLVALRYFGETALTGSMRQAAEHLHVAASAVNRQILKLEDQLQCKLFDRTADGVSLTAAGEVLYNYTLRLERDLDRAISQIDDLRGLRRGHVSIACEDGIGRDFLPPVLARFYDEFPGVTFSVKIASTLDIIESVAEGVIDVGIAMAPPLSPDIAVQASAEMPVGVITAPGSAMARQGFAWLKDVAGERIIQATGSVGGHDPFAQLAGKEVSAPYARFIETNAPDFISNLVQAGLGVGIRTPVGIMQDIELGRLAFVPICDRLAVPTKLVIYAKQHRILPISGAVLLERLKESLPVFRDRVRQLAGTQAPAPVPAEMGAGKA